MTRLACPRPACRRSSWQARLARPAAASFGQALGARAYTSSTVRVMPLACVPGTRRCTLVVARRPIREELCRKAWRASISLGWRSRNPFWQRVALLPLAFLFFSCPFPQADQYVQGQSPSRPRFAAAVSWACNRTRPSSRIGCSFAGDSIGPPRVQKGSRRSCRPPPGPLATAATHWRGPLYVAGVRQRTAGVSRRSTRNCALGITTPSWVGMGGRDSEG